jgi:uncharacterized protein (TIGR02117 family)
MNVLKRVARYLLRAFLAIVVIVLLYMLSAFICSRIAVNDDFVQADDGVTIYVESNGVHTDIVVPAQHKLADWTSLLPYEHFENVDASFEYIAFGWGDKGFYLDTPTWADLKFSTAFKAVFFLSSTAMHVTYKRNAPKESELSRRITISGEQYEKLIAYIKSSFQVSSSNSFIPITHPGYSRTDCFYEAIGTYSFLKTCNVWTGEGLDAAGVRVGWWTPFDSSVFNELPESKEK